MNTSILLSGFGPKKIKHTTKDILLNALWHTFYGELSSNFNFRFNSYNSGSGNSVQFPLVHNAKWIIFMKATGSNGANGRNAVLGCIASSYDGTQLGVESIPIGTGEYALHAEIQNDSIVCKYSDNSSYFSLMTIRM